MLSLIREIAVMHYIIRQNHIMWFKVGFKHHEYCQESQCQNGACHEGGWFWGIWGRLKNYTLPFVRSILEQSAPVWHSSLTEENSDDLEWVQKSAVKLMLGTKYLGYENSLAKLDMISLKDRREQLCLSFAEKCVRNPKTQNMFLENKNKSFYGNQKPWTLQSYQGKYTEV
jgi:hypothetical protein